MKWEEIKLLKETPSGVDELGNEVMILRPVYTTKARFTPEVDVPTELDGRDVTSDTQFFSLPARADLLPPCTHIEYKDMTYKIDTIAAMSPRWTIIKADIYETRTTGA